MASSDRGIRGRKYEFSIPPDNRGCPPVGTIWTGEVQAIAFTSSSTAATEVVIPGRWWRFFATKMCHIVIGTAGAPPATATKQSRCFPIPCSDTAGWTEPIYIPDSFDTKGDGTGKLYIRVIRNAADGYLYIAEAYPSTEGFGDRDPGVGATSTTTTTTTTSTTTTTTTTTSTTT